MKIPAAAALLAAALLQAPDETREPPQIYYLEVDGKRVPVELDRPLEIETKSPATRLTLRSEAHRVFDFAGVRFHYPREMGFEADLEDPSISIWTLDGNDAVVMVQRFAANDAPDGARKMVVTGLVAQYGPNTESREKASLVLGGKTFEGTRVVARIAGFRISQEVYGVRVKEGSAVLLLQDSLRDDGSHTPEYERTVKLLDETFRADEGAKPK